MAGLLDYASSVAGEAKKNVQGLLADPKQALMDVLNNLTARAAASQAATKAAWATRDPKIMAQNALDSSQTALGFAPLGITAWHGSPHKFDKFSMDKIGTGEGAQAYGHGLYLAESPDVANQYRINLAYDPEKMKVGGKQINAVYDSLNQQAARLPPKQAEPIYEQMDLLERLMGNESYEAVADYARSMSPTTRKWLSDTVKPTFETYGHTYKTDIPDEAVARFLDWDKPLSQQPHVMELINKQEAARTQSVLDQRVQTLANVGESAPNASVLKRQIDLLREEVAKPQESGLGAMTGGEYYNYLRRRDVAPTVQADMFKQAGIPGIRYLDGGSRGAGQGSSNFVALDPEMIRILERNGQATGAVPWQPGEWRGLLGNN